MTKINYVEYQGDIDDVPRLNGGNERFNIYATVLPQLPLHYHDYAEISLFLGGEGIETINGVSHHLKEGTVSILLPNHMHTIQSNPSNPVRKYSCLFDVQLLFGLQDDNEFRHNFYSIGKLIPSFYDFSGAEQINLRNVFESLLEFHPLTNEVGYRQMIRVKLTEALLLYMRYSTTQYEIKNEMQSQFIGESNLFSPVLQYVNMHYMKPITLESLSQKFNLSASYISQSFRKYTGNGFIKHLQYLRIKSAINMLKNTNMNITDIALEAGFESYRTFARVFREVKTLSAKEYRKIYVNKDRE